MALSNKRRKYPALPLPEPAFGAGYPIRQKAEFLIRQKAAAYSTFVKYPQKYTELYCQVAFCHVILHNLRASQLCNIHKKKEAFFLGKVLRKIFSIAKILIEYSEVM